MKWKPAAANAAAPRKSAARGAALKRPAAKSTPLKRLAAKSTPVQSAPLRFLLQLVPGTYQFEENELENAEESRRWPWMDDKKNMLPSPYDGLYEQVLELPAGTRCKAVYVGVGNNSKRLELVETSTRYEDGKVSKTSWWSIEFPARRSSRYSSTLNSAHFSRAPERGCDSETLVTKAEHELLMQRPPLGRNRWHVHSSFGISGSMDEVDADVWLIEPNDASGNVNACSALADLSARHANKLRDAKEREAVLCQQLAETRRELLNARADRAALEAVSPKAIQMRVSAEEKREPRQSSSSSPELYVFMRTEALINGRFVYTAPTFESDATAQPPLKLYYAETAREEEKSVAGSWVIARDSKVRDELEDGTVEFCCASEALSPLGPRLDVKKSEGWCRWEPREAYFQRMRELVKSFKPRKYEAFDFVVQIETLDLPTSSH